MSKSSFFFFFFFLHFGRYLFQISPACGPCTYQIQIMYGETLDFQCQHLQRLHGKVLMANFLQKLSFRPDILYYHYWRWHQKSKISPYIKYLDDMLVKFEQNCIVKKLRNFELFWQKMVNHIWESVGAILKEVSVT